MLCPLRGLCLYVLILHHDLAYAYRSAFHLATGLINAYINQEGSQLISRAILRRLKNRAGLDANVALLRSAL